MTNEEKERRLRDILQDPVFNEVVEAVRQDLSAAWAAEQDPVQRELIWHRQNAVSELLTGLRRLGENMKLTSFNAMLRHKHK